MIDFNVIYNVPSEEVNSEQEVREVIENFRKKELDLLDLSDRDLFASEIDLLCQAMYKTAKDLQLKGLPQHKIRDEIKQSIDKSRTALRSSIEKFKSDEAILLKSSKTFHEKASTSQVNFAPIQARPLNKRVSRSNPTMEARKQKLAACIQLSDDTVPQGASYCLNEFSKGLSNEEQQELASIVPRAMIGKSVNEVCVPLAVLGKVSQTVIGASVQAVYLASVSNYCAEAYPQDFNNCVTTLKDACEGKNPEVNKAVAEAMPNWIKETGEFFGRVDSQLMDFNYDMESKYYTAPGLVYEGIHGGIIAGLPVLAKGVSKIKSVVKKTAKRPAIAKVPANDNFQFLPETYGYRI